MMLPALGFACGAWLLQQLPELPDAIWLLLLMPLSGLCWLAPNPLLRTICHSLLALAIGFFWTALCAHHRLSDALPGEWQGRDIQVVGVVASLPQPQDYGSRFQFDVEQVLTADAHVPSHISLAQYDEAYFRKTARVPALTLHAGERWRLTVRLKRPHGTANPYGFDFEAWALERNIRATGYVRKDAANQRLQATVWRPSYLVEMLREQIRQRMRDVLQDRPYAGILQALAIGEESAISAGDWQVFQRTGTVHLMSISGLHVTMLAGLAFGLVYACWRRSERLTLALPARKAATLAGLLLALLYALVAGFSVPAQRTVYMLAVFAWALWGYRHVSVGRVLALALCVVIVLDPWAVLAPGFWLSFSAVALIAFVTVGRIARPHWLGEALVTQWAVTLGLLPLLLVLFQQISLISPLANAVAIPLVSLLIAPLTLLGALLPVDWALQLAHLVVSACMAFLYWLDHLPFSTWQQHAPSGWTLPIALFGVLWTLLPRGFPMRWLGLAGVLPMLVLPVAMPAAGSMRVAVLDVGQGLAVVVQTARHSLLYDSGPRYSTQSDSGSRIVVPYLRAAGIGHLQGMIVSHDDTDHSGGMASVLSQVPVDWLASSLPMVQTDALAVRHMLCYAGQTWRWDGVDFEVLHPQLASYANDVKDNNRSCVLHVKSRYGSLLLTGDIEREAEQALLQGPDKLSADVLVVPHHGSKSSSSEPFVDAVHPAISIFTVGYLNRFGHPKKVVVERYQSIGSRLYRSDRDGAILLDFAENGGIAVERWRQQHKRYWQDGAELAENGIAR